MIPRIYEPERRRWRTNGGTLEVLRLDGGSYRLVTTVRADARVRAEPFDAIELALLWER